MRDKIRAIERIIYPNQIMNKDKFPPIDSLNAAIMEMESYVFDFSCWWLCYIYVRENESGWFVDVYFYMMNENNKLEIKRFIIAPGYAMHEDEEEEFLYLSRAGFMVFNERVCGCVYSELDEIAPELHLVEYKDFGKMLHHIYFASFRSGIRELLFKAGGLDEIAMSLSTVDDWDLMGKNVSQAFNHIPYKMLKKLNSQNAVLTILHSEDTRTKAKEIYEKYHVMLNDINQINEFQFRYLNECMADNIVLPNKHILKELANLKSGWSEDIGEDIDGHEIYNKFMYYQELINKMDKYKSVFPRYPSLAEQDRFWELLQILELYIKQEAVVDKRLLELSCIWNERYFYEDDRYVIVVPKGIEDILQESEHMHNCLYSYVLPIMNGSTTVVFMRDKKKPMNSLVSVEIKEGSINQALQCCNKEITPIQKAFLKSFAKKKGLKYGDVPRMVEGLRIDNLV